MLGTLIVGMLVGLAARRMHPAGLVISVPAALLCGAVGALAAFYGGRSLRLYTDGQLMGWVAAIAGAAVLVGVWGLVPRRGRR